MPIRKTKLYRACDGICHYCGIKTILGGSIKNKMSATVDHKIPKSKLPKGIYVEGNYVIACRGCNEKKGTMDYDNFMLKIKDGD